MTIDTMISSTGQAMIETIVSMDDTARHRGLGELCSGLDQQQLLNAAADLDRFWRDAPNLYH